MLSPTSSRKLVSLYRCHNANCPSVQIKSFVEGLFTYNSNYDRFKLNLRDFLIQLKEFSGDNAELYAEEKEQQEKEAKAAERERLSKVGGLLKPSELAEDDDEL